jgi:hypothetical protein
MHAGHPALAFSLVPTTVLEAEELARGSNLEEMLVAQRLLHGRVLPVKGNRPARRRSRARRGDHAYGSRALAIKLICSVVELGAREILKITTLTWATP